MEYGVCCDEMWVDTETSELVCKSCGRVETIMGVPFNEYQFFDQTQKGQPPSTKKKTIQHICVKSLKNSKSLTLSTSPVKKNMTRSGIVSWMLSSMTFVMVASRSTMSAFCMITFKQFLLTLGRERKKSSNFFLPTSRKFGKPAGTRKQGSASGGKKQNRGEALFEKNIGNLFRFHPFQCFKKIF